MGVRIGKTGDRKDKFSSDLQRRHNFYYKLSALPVAKEAAYL